MGRFKMIVTIDVECDKSSDWRTSTPVTFRGVTEGVGRILSDLFSRWGVRPTYLLSPEVMTDIGSCDVLRELRNCELGTHLHGDYIAPSVTHKAIAGTLTEEMQWEYPAELEDAKLSVLTELFAQQFDRRPVSFRAGRFGIGGNTGRILENLGYLVDSSVTPHVTWTSRNGESYPNFVGVQESPYRIGSEGNLLRPGSSRLLELPVTVLDSESGPVWFRPWYSGTDTLRAVMQRVCRENEESGSCRPLVMMFHNVEVIPGASPYPQTDEEVRCYLQSLEAVFQEAARLGISFCTMHEYYDQHAVEVTTSPELEPGIDMDAALVEEVIDRHGAQAWFKYVFKERKSRWDCWEPCHWMHSNLSKDARILSTGTGVGFNLIWLALHGYPHLYGFDIDGKAIAAGCELASLAGRNIHLWLDDGLKPHYIPLKNYDAIEALVWTYFIEGFDYTTFLSTYRSYLSPKGVIIFDVIDADYNSVPENEFHTQDREKPIPERRSSEYKVRVAEKDVREIVKHQGLKLLHIITRSQEIPKKVYIVQKV